MTFLPTILRYLIFSLSAPFATLAAPITVLEDDFESYATGVDTLVYPWSVTEVGSAGVVGSGFGVDDAAGYLGGGVAGSPSACWVRGTAWVEDPTSDNRPIWKASLMIGLRGSTNGQDDPFSVEVYNQDGNRLVQLAFANLGSTFSPFYRSSAEPDAVTSGLGLAENTGYQVELQLDFETNRWSAWIGSTAIVTDQPMAAEGVAANTASLALAWFITNPGTPGDNLVYFDDVRVERISGPYPFIDTPPSGVVAEAGETATFEVQASGEATLSYQWWKDGAPLDGETSAALVISDLDPTDSGSYLVVVSNSRGSVESPPASLSVTAPGSRNLVEWGPAASDSNTMPAGISDWIHVACSQSTASGGLATVGVREDGTVLAWGDGANAQVSALPVGISARHVALGTGHGLAVLRDGGIVGWGDDSYGQATPPTEPDEPGARRVAAGVRHSIALMEDGTLRGWGSNYTPSGWSSSYTGQASPPSGSSFGAIDCGYYHGIALRVGYGGAIETWGSNGSGQLDVPYMSSVKAIAAGAYHNLAVDGNGNVVAWGRNAEGQCDVPVGLTDVISVAAGYNWSAALKSDGTVVTWGGDGSGEASPPGGLSDVRLIAGGGYSAATIFGNPFSPVIASEPEDVTVPFHSPASFSVDAFLPVSQGTPEPYVNLRWHIGESGDFTLPVTGYIGSRSDYSTGKLDEQTDFWVRAYATDDNGDVSTSISSRTATAFMDPVPVVHDWSPPTAIGDGDSATIEIEFGAGSPFSVEWFRDGVSLGAGEVNGFVARLDITGFSELEDAGIYQAVVTNSLGDAASGEIPVELRSGPPDLSVQLLADLETAPQLPNSSTASNFKVAEVNGLKVFSSQSGINESHTYAMDAAGEVTEIRTRAATMLRVVNGSIVGHDYDGLYAISPGDEVPVDLAAVSQVGWIGEIGGVHYFAGRTAEYGNELWRTDGTPDGTEQVVDLYPGPASGFYNSSSNYVRILGDRIFFVGSDAVSGQEPFASDGTAEGTELLADIRAGGGSSQVQIQAVSEDLVMFLATSDATGAEPWVTDGTPGGTFLLSDFRPGSNGTFLNVAGVWNGDFVFSANTGSGTKMYRFGPGMTLPQVMGNHSVSRGKLYPVAGGFLFSGYIENSDAGTELCFSDGTPAGTVLVMDVDTSRYGYVGGSSPNSSDPTFHASVGSRHLFIARMNTSASELWSTDTTSSGTLPLIEFNSGEYSTSIRFASGAPSGIGAVFLLTSDGETGIWTSDGTPTGTVEVAPLVRPDGLSSSVLSFEWIGSLLYLTGNDGSMWTWSPGSDEADWLGQFELATTNNTVSPLTEIDDEVWVYAYDKGAGPEWWKTDGTASSLQQATDLYGASSTASSNPTLLAPLAGGVLFTAESEGSRKLWVTDPVNAEPRLVGDYRPSSVVLHGEHAYFSWIGDSGWDLWRTDGTADGTERVTFRNFEAIREMAAVSSMDGIVFGARPENTSSYYHEPWFCDGTDAGTVAMLEGITEIQIRDPKFDDTREIGGSIVFPVDYWVDVSGGTNYGRGKRMVSWDGGTPVRLVTDPYGTSYQPEPFASDATRVFFRRYDNQTGWEPWVTDGTVAGTGMIKDTVPGSSSSQIEQAVWLDGELFFVNQRTKLWKTDGTAAGTSEVWGGDGNLIRNLTVFRNGLYFTLRDDLWTSNGTAAGTALAVADVGWSYYSDGGFSGMVEFDGALFLYGSIGLVRSTGTTGGTYKIETHRIDEMISSEDRLFLRPGTGWSDVGTELLVLTRAVPEAEIAGSASSTSVGAEGLVLEVDSDDPDLSFQWYQGEVGDRSQPVGEGLASFEPGAGLGWRRFWVSVSADLATTEVGPFDVEGVTELEAWARSIEPASPGGMSPLDLDSDDDGDGLEAILEFALGTDVEVSDAPPEPLRLEWVEVEGIEVLAFVHALRTGQFSGVTYIVEHCGRLGTDPWVPLSDQTSRFTLRTLGPDFEESGLVIGVVRGTEEAGEFYRLNVEPSVIP
ncbi:immunoglobulin domain-containing protein [Coraliomargarita sinensis]|nr:immunoglobulin domain-containing protein [Coraliomargarita sinensis]